MGIQQLGEDFAEKNHQLFEVKKKHISHENQKS